jgi:hypothetical protein
VLCCAETRRQVIRSVDECATSKGSRVRFRVRAGDARVVTAVCKHTVELVDIVGDRG